MSHSGPARLDPRPLIAHVVYRFDVGGLENGIVNLLNRLPVERYRHAIVALTDVTDFRMRVRRDDVRYLSLHKAPGQGIRMFPALYRVFRDLRPDIVHTRNLAALEASLPAWAAGVPLRIHGEHGWDVRDPDGSNVTYRRVRRFYRPFVQDYVALSTEAQRYLLEAIRVPTARVHHICNGVDVAQFTPPTGGRIAIRDCPFQDRRHWIVGTVGRLDAVKDQVALAQAFARLATSPGAEHLRLVIVGEGPLRTQIEATLRDAGVADRAWMPGKRSDVAELLRGLDCFVLPSRAEGISNTILEAMATGLPVVATGVGGNVDLVEDGGSGALVPAHEPVRLAEAIVAYAQNPDLARAAGARGRARAVERFSIERMVQQYQALYDAALARRAGRETMERAGTPARSR